MVPIGGGRLARQDRHDVSTEVRPSTQAIELDTSGYATCTFCSWQESDWRSVLLRRYDNAPVADAVEVPPVDDQLLVLVTEGQAVVEAVDGARWRSAVYTPGSLAMTAPGHPSRLRWRTTLGDAHRTLHLYLPGKVLADAAEHVWGRDVRELGLPDALATTDPVVASVMLGMAEAAEAGAGDLYAESARTFLGVHLLSRHATARAPTGLGGRAQLGTHDGRVRRAVEFMHDNLALPLTLADIARAADLSTFHFLRLFKAAVGEPPRAHLTRLRVEAACRHLRRGDLPVTEIAYLCGFSSPAHLSATFRRRMGTTPTAYRQERRA